MVELIVTLTAALLGLLGYTFFQVGKRKSAEAGLENLETKEDLLALEKTKVNDNEEQARKELLLKLESELSKVVTNEELAKFFNNKKKD